MSDIEVMRSLLTSSVLVSVIAVIGNVLMFILNRRATKKDRQDDSEDKISMIEKRISQLEIDRDNDRRLFRETIRDITESLIDVKDGQKVILYDRILYISRKFILEGSISYEDKTNLNKMYSVYHNQLGGNRDLDTVIRDINELPTKY